MRSRQYSTMPCGNGGGDSMRAPKSFEEGMNRLEHDPCTDAAGGHLAGRFRQAVCRSCLPDEVLPCNAGKDVVADRGNQCKDCRDRGHHRSRRKNNGIYATQYQEYLLQATAALELPASAVFCPKNRRYAVQPGTALLGGGKAHPRDSDAQCLRYAGRRDAALPNSSRQRWRCCTATR